MNVIIELQNWYKSQCDADWEHSYGISIDTLDNPGWAVSIDLSETNLENISFSERSYGLDENSSTIKDNWLHCCIENNKFKGNGGPEKLEEIIQTFLNWVRLNT